MTGKQVKPGQGHREGVGNKALVVLGYGASGPERRLARIFARWSKSDPRLYFITSTQCFAEFVKAGILDESQRNVVQLKHLWIPMSNANQVSVARSRFNLIAFTLQLILVSFFYRMTAYYTFITYQHLIMLLPFVTMGWPKILMNFCNWDVRGSLRMKRAMYVLRRCAVIDALSESIARELERSGLPSDRLRVSPSGFFDSAPYFPEWPKEPWIVFSGRFFHDKNPVLAVEALPHVLRVHPEVHLFMFGGGPEYPKMIAAIQQLGLEKHTTVGWVAEPAATLRRSRVFLSLQVGENYPSQSLLEAMAAGNAVVATDVGETRRLVTEDNGVLVAADPRQVGEAILQLLDDPNLLQKAQRSREIALQHTGVLYLPYIRSLFARAASVRGR